MERVRQEVGGSAFNALLDDIRMSIMVIKRHIETIIDGNAGPQAILALSGKIIVEVLNITNAVNQLERIGDAAKNERRR